MNDISEKRELKKNWSLTKAAFDGLLRWLDDASGTEGNGYLMMRSRLVTYFDRKNCANPDDLADETLDRVGRRLEEEGSIETEAPAKYCYALARFVFLEHLRTPSEVSLDGFEQAANQRAAEPGEDRMRHETRLECLERCAASLDDGQRELITRYYSGEKRVKIENRKRMAKGLAMSLNALGIRAFRIREKLEKCVTECVRKKERD